MTRKEAHSDTELTDAEAEATLIALAPPLEWRWYNEDTSANAPNGLYTAEANPPHGETSVPFYRAEFIDETDLTLPFEQRVFYAPHAFPHIEQAKAACEYHYVTGQWE